MNAPFQKDFFKVSSRSFVQGGDDNTLVQSTVEHSLVATTDGGTSDHLLNSSYEFVGATVVTGGLTLSMRVDLETNAPDILSRLGFLDFKGLTNLTPASFVSATLSFRVSGNASGASLGIFGHKAPVPITDPATDESLFTPDIGAKTWTTASLLQAWASSATPYVEDVTAIVSEIINHASWAGSGGSKLRIYLNPDWGSVGSIVVSGPSNATTANRPKLSITYLLPA